MSKKLTEKQRRFVEAYMGEACGNGTEAARIAGYKGSGETIRATASRLLTKDNIANAIKERQDNDPLVQSREQRQQWLTDVIEGKVYDYDTNRDGEIVSKPAKLADRLKAADLLSKMGGDYTKTIKVEDKRSELDAFADYFSERTDAT